VGQVLLDKSCGTSLVGQVLWDKSCGTSLVGQVLWDKSCGTSPVLTRPVYAHHAEGLFSPKVG
jgi:hypothetical protein